MRPLLSLALALFVAMAGCGPSNEQSWESYRSAAKDGNWRGAVDAITPLAESGDAQAQHALSLAFENFSPPNKMEAFRWMLSSAKAGNREAMRGLASLYREGNAGRTDYVEAAAWIKKSFENSDRLTPRDASELYLLGAQYLEGKGVPSNPVYSHVLMNLAGSLMESLRAPSQHAIGHLERKMTDEQIAEAQAIAVKCSKYLVLCAPLR